MVCREDDVGPYVGQKGVREPQRGYVGAHLPSVFRIEVDDAHAELAGIDILDYLLGSPFPEAVKKGGLILVPENDLDKALHDVGKASHGHAEEMGGSIRGA